MNYLSTFVDNVSNPEWLKDNKILVASSLGAAVSVCGLSYYLYQSSKSNNDDEDDSLPYLLSKYNNIKEGTKYYEYSESLRNDWFHSVKLLKKYTLFYSVPNGSKIYYNEFGDPNGFPILHFHGSGGSHLEGIIFDALARKYKLHIIVCDRPGHGLSTIRDNNNYNDLNINDPNFYSFEQYSNDLSIFLKNVFKINPNETKFGISGASQGGIFAIAMTGFLKKLKFNVSICLVFGGLPLSKILTVLNAKTGSDSENKNNFNYNETVSIAIPKSIVDNWNLSQSPLWLQKFFAKGFVWYNERQNFKVHKDDLNYNWALDFLSNSDLLPPCDIEELTKHVKGQFATILKKEKEESKEEEKVELNSYYFSKILGNYSYKFQEQVGERWTVSAQKHLDVTNEYNNVLQEISTSEIPIVWYHGTQDRLIPMNWVKAFIKHLQTDFLIKNIEFIELEQNGHIMFTFDNIEKGYQRMIKILDI